MGKHGSSLHMDILERIRCNFPIVARSNGWETLEDYFLIVDEGMMLRCVGETGIGTRKKGGRIPDAIIILDEQPLIIEIGKYNPDKWKQSEFSVIHIGFNCTVTPIYGGVFNDDKNRIVVDLFSGFIEDSLTMPL